MDGNINNNNNNTRACVRVCVCVCVCVIVCIVHTGNIIIIIIASSTGDNNKNNTDQMIMCETIKWFLQIKLLYPRYFLNSKKPPATNATAQRPRLENLAQRTIP